MCEPYPGYPVSWDTLPPCKQALRLADDSFCRHFLTALDPVSLRNTHRSRGELAFHRTLFSALPALRRRNVKAPGYGEQCFTSDWNTDKQLLQFAERQKVERLIGVAGLCRVRH